MSEKTDSRFFGISNQILLNESKETLFLEFGDQSLFMAGEGGRGDTEEKGFSW
jgi:hypothetical protein